jgi:hypothetical protein
VAGPADKSREPSDDEFVEPPSSSEATVERHPGESVTGSPVLPDRSSDETEVGWGDESPRYDDDWYLNERPPHHG